MSQISHNTILNIIWLVLAGIWLWLGYMLAGLLKVQSFADTSDQDVETQQPHS